MERQRQLEIAEWTPEAAIATRALSSAPVRRSRVPPALAGLIGTLILHGIAIQSVMLESSGAKAPIPKIIPPGTAESLVSPESPLILIMMSAGPSQGKVTALENFPAPMLAINGVPIAPSPPSAVDIAERSDSEAENGGAPSAGDVAEHARLAGIYSTQVSARIERVWRKPRISVQDESRQNVESDTEETFRCQVQIVQNATGGVQEVLLPNCNGSQAWQNSLVQAIYEASPLPAPPSPSVYTAVMTLNFIAFQYKSDSSPEEYEMVRRQGQN